MNSDFKPNTRVKVIFIYIPHETKPTLGRLGTVLINKKYKQLVSVKLDGDTDETLFLPEELTEVKEIING